MPLFFVFIFEPKEEIFFIIFDMIKSVFNKFLVVLNLISSFDHIFIFFVLQIHFPELE